MRTGWNDKNENKYIFQYKIKMVPQRKHFLWSCSIDDNVKDQEFVWKMLLTDSLPYKQFGIQCHFETVPVLVTWFAETNVGLWAWCMRRRLGVAGPITSYLPCVSSHDAIGTTSRTPFPVCSPSPCRRSVSSGLPFVTPQDIPTRAPTHLDNYYNWTKSDSARSATYKPVRPPTKPLIQRSVCNHLPPHQVRSSLFTPGKPVETLKSGSQRVHLVK